MYFAMDEPGLDKQEQIRALRTQDEKWRALDALAGGAGLEGVQITTTLYEKTLGLSPDTVPDFIRQYRLTYHIGGLFDILTEDGLDALHAALDTALRRAAQNGFHDVSLHPPTLPPGMAPARGYVRERFQEAMGAWVRRFRWEGVTLSVESHVYAPAFVFQGMSDYQDFILGVDGLGALIDISHNCYDGYSENDLLNWIAPLPITGFHISDADPALPLDQGTHLPVGRGTVGLRRFLAPFIRHRELYGALEIKAPYDDIRFSAERLQGYRKTQMT